MSFLSRNQFYAVGPLVICSPLILSVFFQVSTVQDQPGWMWRLQVIPIQWLILLLTVCIALLLIYRTAVSNKGWHRIIVLIVLGVSLQWGFSLARGLGVNGMRFSTIHNGHSEFIRTASRNIEEVNTPEFAMFSSDDGLSLNKVIGDYENFVGHSEQLFAKSKPPGQLSFYILAAKLATTVMPKNMQEHQPLQKVVDDSHRRTIEFLVLWFPFVAALVAWPFLCLARRFISGNAWFPVLLFLCGPSFVLVLMHLDQVLYPMLSCSLWLSCLFAMESKNKISWSICSGVLAWICVFVSFSLLPAIVLVPIVMLAKSRDSYIIKILLISLFGFLSCAVLFALIWSYNPLIRFNNAMTFHAMWKHQLFQQIGWFSVLRLNITEALWWLGPPSSLVLLWSFGRSSINFLGKKMEEVDYLAFGLLLVVCIVLFTGQTVGEIARLWLFLMPFAFLIVGRRITEWSDDNGYILYSWIFWQLLWTISFRYGQNFY
jgi:hypothetical protein